jgi:hypothetical protein
VYLKFSYKEINCDFLSLCRRGYLEGLHVNGMTIFKNTASRNRMGGYILDSPDKGWENMLGSCEHSNESSAYVNSRRFLD